MTSGSGTLDAQRQLGRQRQRQLRVHRLAAGTVNGLASSLSLVLWSNGSERLAVTADGAFAFAGAGRRHALRRAGGHAAGHRRLQSVNNGSGLFYADRFSDIVVSCN